MSRFKIGLYLLVLSAALWMLADPIAAFAEMPPSYSGRAGEGAWNSEGDPIISCAVANILQLIEGSFGALIMVVAGLGSIIAAAMGGYRAAVGMLVVAIGGFILRALVTLFFGGDYTYCF